MGPDIVVAVVTPDPMLGDLLVDSLTAAGLAAVASIGTAAGLVQTCTERGVTVAVVDVDVAPAGELEELIRRLLASRVRTLVVTGSSRARLGPELLLAGASGLLATEQSSPQDLVAAVTTVAAGKAALHPDVAHAVLEQWRAMRRVQAADVGAAEPAGPGGARTELSARERAVLQCMAAGMTTRTTARSLEIAEKTVETHKSRIYAKLGVRNQAHAVWVAVSRGLLTEVDTPDR